MPRFRSRHFLRTKTIPGFSLYSRIGKNAQQYAQKNTKNKFKLLMHPAQYYCTELFAGSKRNPHAHPAASWSANERSGRCADLAGRSAAGQTQNAGESVEAMNAESSYRRHVPVLRPCACGDA
jgi:hypothetical protein